MHSESALSAFGLKAYVKTEAWVELELRYLQSCLEGFWLGVVVLGWAVRTSNLHYLRLI